MTPRKIPPMQCPTCGTHNGKHTVGCAAAFPAVDDVEALRKKVTLMREMGVLEADGIKLGPLPQPPKKEETEEEWKERQTRIAQRQHDILFSASATKPRLKVVKK